MMETNSMKEEIYWENQAQESLPPRTVLDIWGGGSVYKTISEPNDGWILSRNLRRIRIRNRRLGRVRMRDRERENPPDVVGMTRTS